MSDEIMPHPGVRFPPPTLFIAGLALGAGLGRLGPSLQILATPHAAVRITAIVLIAAGALLAAWGMIVFTRARTAIYPTGAARTIVDDGPYRFTRNPMYTGMVLAYLGATLLLNTLWPLALLPIVLALLVRLVIRREEAYLSEAFPDEYARYRVRVRRWL